MADNKIANAIKFLKGEEKSLPAAKTEGQVYFAYKNVGTAEKPSYTGAIYIDTPIGGTQNRIKMTANADIADKAFNDSAGLSIRGTYLSSLGYTDDGKQTILIKGSGNNQTRIALPIASTTKSGIVTTDAQSFGGIKTFTTINSTNLTVTGSSGFSYTGIETATGDKARPVWFAYDGINGKPVVNTNFTYNPATQTLSVANLSGTADKAIKDSAGNDIRNTYIKNITVNGTTLTFTKGGGATSSITLQDTNNKVTQTAIKSSDYTNWRTVLWGASNSATEGFAPTTVTDGTFTSDTLTFQPSSGTLKAKVFKGSLLGNASTATSATKATYDSSGTKDIRSYVSDVTISGRTITVTKGSGAKVTLTTQDTDTWRGIQNNLTSDSTTDSLSAAQGKYLKSLIDGKSNNGHNHDDRYYTETEINNKLANYLLLSGGTLTGALNFANGIWNVVGDDVAIGDMNIAGTLGVMGKNGNTAIKLVQFGASTTGGDAAPGVTWTCTGNGTSTISGILSGTFSGSLSGNATSANKLNANAGSIIQPIYFSNGIPVSCAYTLGKSVPSNAVFTDTWRPIENSLTSTSTSNSLSAAQGKILNELTFQKRNVIDDTVDWDTLKDIGCYKIQMASWGDVNTKHGPNSYSQNLYSFGLLLVFKATDSDGEKRTMQVYFPHQENAGAFNIIMTRMFNNSWWTAWHPIGSGTGWAEILNKPASYPPSDHTHPYLPLSGGTLTGFVLQTGSGSKDVGYEAKNTDTGASIKFIVGSGKINKGVYDTNADNWMVYADQNNKVHLNGNAWTATTATNAYYLNIVANNEIRFNKPSDALSSNALHIGYKWADGTLSKMINEYRFCGGDGQYTQVTASQFNGNLNGNANTASNLNGINTILSIGVENSAITIKTNDNGIFTLTSNCSLRNAIDFRWYETNWQIGNIRGGSTDSVGFGFAFSSNGGNTFALKSYIDTNGYYHGGVVGNASTATALTSSAGSSTQPVYFSGGKPVACTYTLSKSVPADAKFTDTNTWRPLGTTGDTACAGNDSRLSNARPASDVYAWAKASSKPTYSWGEITGKPSTFTPSSHSHGLIDSNFYVDLANTTTDNGWSMLSSAYSNAKYNGHLLKSIRTQANAPAWTLGDYAAGIVFGGADTKGVITCSYNQPCIKFAGGNGAKPVWYISLTGTSGKSYDLNNMPHAETATNSTKWNGRTLDIDTEAGSDAGWLLIDNGGIVRHRSASYFATASHTHNYLPLAGGTMNGTSFITWPDSGNWSNNNNNVTFPVSRGGLQWYGQSDYVKLFSQETGNDNLDLVLQFGDDSSNGLSIRNSTGTQTARIDTNGNIAAASLRVGNGSGSTINFCTNGSTANPGAKIVAYNDRIEFVFA